jgi:hypothetical protein
VTVDYSQLVNSADFVVRFNEMRNYGYNSGTKVDALCVTNISTPGRLFSKSKTLEKFSSIETLKEIWFPRTSNHLPCQFWFRPLSTKVFSCADYRNHIIARNNFHQKNIVYFSDDLYAACCSELDIDCESINFSPSTEYLAIKYVLQRFGTLDTRISLIGFSFDESSCYLYKNEKNSLIELQKRGLIYILNFYYYDYSFVN